MNFIIAILLIANLVFFWLNFYWLWVKNNPRDYNKHD